VAVDATRAYVADGASGLQVINVSNPAAPARYGGYDTTGTAYGVAISGTVAYVADGASGLQVISVSVFTYPMRICGYDTSGTAYGVAVVGTTAYVADGASGLQVIDVTKPSSPVRLGGYDTTGTAYGVAVVGSLAYVADGASGLQIINVSNPAFPVRVGAYDTSGEARGVVIYGKLAYVADTNGGLQVIDVSNPSAPARVGGYSTAGPAQGVAVSGGLAFVAADTTGLQVIRPFALVSAVTPVSDTTFCVQFGEALPGGNYRVFVGPDVTGTSGSVMDQDRDGIGGEPFDDVYAGAFSKQTASVVGRYVFYNGSCWDGNDPAANAGDDAAIDIGKVALLPAGTPGPANVTGYGGGINGIMVDVAGLVGPLTAGDFVFRAGGAGDPSTWQAAAAPQSITVRPGQGQGGSDRVTIVWADGAIVGQWLQVTVLGNARTNLPGDDVFFFGNLPGDVNGDGVTDATDYLALKQAFGGPAGGPAQSADLDGDGQVGCEDLLLLGSCFGGSIGMAAFPASAPAAGLASPLVGGVAPPGDSSHAATLSPGFGLDPLPAAHPQGIVPSFVGPTVGGQGAGAAGSTSPPARSMIARGGQPPGQVGILAMARTVPALADTDSFAMKYAGCLGRAAFPGGRATPAPFRHVEFFPADALAQSDQLLPCIAPLVPRPEVDLSPRRAMNP
jgi:hypothetical protein